MPVHEHSLDKSAYDGLSQMQSLAKLELLLCGSSSTTGYIPDAAHLEANISEISGVSTPNLKKECDRKRQSLPREPLLFRLEALLRIRHVRVTSR